MVKVVIVIVLRKLWPLFTERVIALFSSRTWENYTGTGVSRSQTHKHEIHYINPPYIRDVLYKQSGKKVPAEKAVVNYTLYKRQFSWMAISQILWIRLLWVSLCALFQRRNTSAVSNLFLISVLKHHTHIRLCYTMYLCMVDKCNYHKSLTTRHAFRTITQNTQRTQSLFVTNICDIQNSAKVCLREEGGPHR